MGLVSQESLVRVILFAGRILGNVAIMTGLGLNYLDKTYRMIKAVYNTTFLVDDDAVHHITVPINHICVSAMWSRHALPSSSMPWIYIVITRGIQAGPCSTSIMSRRKT